MSDEKNIGSQKVAEEGLEPIDKKDLNLAGKFGHIEKSDIQKAEKDSQEEVKTVENREIASEMISAEKDSVYQKILSKVKQKNGAKKIDENEIFSDAEKASLQKTAETRIQILVDLAKEKGVVHSIKVARHLDSNYVLDCLHDKLLEERLTEEGLI